MAKRTLAVIFIILIVTGIAVGGYYISKEPTAQAVGSSVLSLQKADFFKSSSDCFDSSSGDLWVYTIRGGGLGQYAEGEWNGSGDITPKDVDNNYDGKEVPEKTFGIDTEFHQQCVYPLVANSQATPIYKLADPIEWFCLSYDQEKALENCGSDSFSGKYSYSTTCWCSSKIQKTGAVGSSYNFNNPSTATEMIIKVDNGGTPSSKTFNTESQIRGRVSSNVCAVWNGNTVTGQVCGLPQDDTRPAYISGQWKLLSDDKYVIYNSAWGDWLSIVQSGSKSQSAIENAIDTLNAKSDSALNSRISFGTIDQPTSLQNAKIIKELDSLIQYPVLTMYVKADWIGVVTPIPDPSIEKVSSGCFSSGRTGTITLEVKNKGTERGEIDFYADCDSGFDVSRKSLSFAGGETKTVILEITGTTDKEELTGTCKVYADAIENIDTRTVEVCTTGYESCIKDTEWCEDKNRWWCPDPIKPELKENCVALGKVCNYAGDGTTFCEDDEDWCENHPDDPRCDGSECGTWLDLKIFKIPDLWCLLNQFIEKFKIVFAIIVGFLGGLLSGSYINKLIPFNTSKNKWIAFLVTFAVLGGAFGYLAYIYFWWILLALIILGIVRAFIPGI